VKAVVIVPARDEAERIEATVRAARTIPGVIRVLVVDDASSDDTAGRATAAGADVLRLERNVGKGAALQAGLERVRRGKDVVLLLDADLGETAAQGGLLLEPVLEGLADMTIARFPKPADKAGFGLVMRLARWGIRRYGRPDFQASAPLSGQRALTPIALDAVAPFESGYGVEVALTARALRAGLRVLEVDTTMAHAATGRDLAGFVHRGRQFADVARALMALRRSARRSGRA
jgi:glycosyltransferase involved in cell wall biosynthesis